MIPDLERPDVTPKSYPGKLSQQGRKKNTNEYIVTLDEYTFRYVWEMLEARAHKDHKQYHAVPAILSVTETSLNSFRRSYASTNGIEKPKAKKLVKKVSE